MGRLRIPLFAFFFATMPLVAAAQKEPAENPGTSHAQSREHGQQGFELHGPMGMDRQMRTERSLNVLQQKLNLSDSQASRVKQLVESRKTRLQSIRDEGRPKFRELMALLNKPNPDPNAVGQAAIALKQIHERVKTEQSNVENDFMNILNDTQRQTVNQLKGQAPTVMALHSLGLLGPEERFEQQTRMMER